ncbi:MAG: c-type cytochrome [Gammaproteobacteria bacterium]|nr:c-type cytochrome [Gammaproteobacteria bacterium]
MVIKSLLLSLIFFLAGLIPVFSQEKPGEKPGDIVAGSKKVETCLGCHGIDNYKTNFPELYRVPKIFGQNVGYLMASLKDYQSGQRKNPVMVATAKSLSDQDIKDIAAYFSSFTVEPQKSLKSIENKRAQDIIAKGNCMVCHGDDFSQNQDLSIPKLAGQYADYMFASLKSYKNNDNIYWGRGNAVMAGVVKDFNLNELRLVAHYISQKAGTLQTLQHSRFRSK